MSTFNLMLKQLRLKEGLTQKELGDRLGLAKTTIGMYEQGRREPDFETLEKIADYFNVDMNFLTGSPVTSADGYYADPETAAFANELFTNPDMRVLFSAAREATPEAVQMAIKIMTAMKQTNPE